MVIERARERDIASLYSVYLAYAKRQDEASENEIVARTEPPRDRLLPHRNPDADRGAGAWAQRHRFRRPHRRDTGDHPPGFRGGPTGVDAALCAGAAGHDRLDPHA